MKSVNNEDIREFDHCQQIAHEIKAVIRGESADREMIEKNITSSLAETFSSEQRFAQAGQMLREAYQRRDSEGLMRRITHSTKRRHALRNASIAISAVAAIILVGLFVLQSDPITETSSSKNSKITTPTLFVSKKIIRLSEPARAITASDYAQDRSVMQRLVVPAGYTYTVTLPDGSKAIVNAGSQLCYPSAFDSTVREVEISGEAYFEVVHNPDCPFIVRAKSGYVKVLGTSFNVKLTHGSTLGVVLVEGAVEVGAEKVPAQRITPNHMARLNLESGEINVTEIHASDYIGWTRGLFLCNNMNFNDLIDEIALWYGVEFKYDHTDFNTINVNLSLNRKSSINELLLFIECAADVKFIKERSGVYTIKANE